MEGARAVRKENLHELKRGAIIEIDISKRTYVGYLDKATKAFVYAGRSLRIGNRGFEIENIKKYRMPEIDSIWLHYEYSPVEDQS